MGRGTLVGWVCGERKHPLNCGSSSGIRHEANLPLENQKSSDTMINDDTSKINRKVDGRFSLSVGDNPDIYLESSVVKQLSDQLNAAKDALDTVRKEHTLVLFRAIVTEHKAKFGVAPTRCILNYREFNNIVHASNEEEGSHYQSQYNETADIDGITICKGCNTKPGEFRLETTIKE
jgi:hypothetical protein